MLMVRKGSQQQVKGVTKRRWFFDEIGWAKGITTAHVHRIAVAVTLLAIVTGLLMEVQNGQANSSVDWTKYPTIEAARYVDLHTPKNAIVMARLVDIVYHYCKRKVVWFPPISDPDVLMDGIRKHRVEFIIVLERSTYWLPPDYDCFQRLLGRYPRAFAVVYHGAGFNIFRVCS